jgi:hypothetical protein
MSPPAGSPQQTKPATNPAEIRPAFLKAFWLPVLFPNGVNNIAVFKALNRLISGADSGLKIARKIGLANP